VLKLLKRWNLQFGVRLTQFDHRFTQQYSQNEGGFYDTDTIDTYYTVTDLDTTWYYVTDSSWVPVEIREYNYQHTNTLGYLVFNLSVSFDLYQDKKIRVYLKAGGELDLLMYRDGLAVFGDDQKETTDFDELDFNTTNYAISVGTGLKYRLADKLDFNTELYYTRHLNDLVPDVPLDTKINAVGLKLGLVFYF
jgi:opacity protein-like surface antigen